MRPLFYDRCLPRPRVQLMLFGCELLAILAAAVFATGALSGSWPELAAVAFWALLPRLGSRCLEWSGNAPQSPVVLAAGVGLLVVVGAYGWVQVVGKLDVPPPVLALLSGLWVSGALLFDYRVYRLHDVALFGVLISAMAFDRSGAWWAVPVVLVMFGAVSAFRHLLYDVYSEETPAPINLQSSQAVGWLGGGAAAVVFLLLTGLLWWVEPGEATGPSVDPSEIAKSEGAADPEGAAGDATASGEDGDDESAEGADASDGEAAADEAAAGDGEEEAATEEEASADPAAEEEASTEEEATVEPELPVEEETLPLPPPGNLVEIPELPDPIEPEEPEVLGPYGGTPRRPKSADQVVDNDTSTRVKFRYGAEDFVPGLAEGDTPTGSRRGGTATGSGNALSGAAGLSSAATARSGKVPGSGGGQKTIGSSTPTAPGIHKGADSGGSGSSAGSVIVFNEKGQPLTKKEVEELQDELPENAADVVAMALAEQKRAAEEAAAALAGDGNGIAGDEVAEASDAADEATAGVDADTGELLGPIGDAGSADDEVAAAELLPNPTVDLDYLSGRERTSSRNLSELLGGSDPAPVAAGEKGPEGDDDDEESDSNAVTKEEEPLDPRLVGALTVLGLLLGAFALRTFFARSPKDDRRAAAPSSGGGTLTIVPLGASVHRSRRAAGSPEEAVLIAYDDLQVDLARRRFHRREHETPREQRRRLVARDDQVDQPLSFVVGCVYDVLYGRYGVDPNDAAEVEASCDDVRDQLIR